MVTARLRIFGPTELRDGQGVHLNSLLAHSKHVALLAYLAMQPGSLHRRDWLTSLLWPDLDDARARNALSKALHHLRRALGEGSIVTAGDALIGIGADHVWCDAAEFEAAAAAGRHEDALAMYGRGELLEGFGLQELPEFERWLEPVRIRLRQRAVTSATALIDAALRRGEVARAAEWAGTASQLSPHDESIVRRQMTLLAQASDRAAALRVYQNFAQRIERDLEVTPSDETRALAETLRDISPEVRARITSEEAPAARPLVTATAGTSSRRIAAPRAIVAAVAAFLLVTSVVVYRIVTGKNRSEIVAVGPLINSTGDTSINRLAGVAEGRLTAKVVQTQTGAVLDLARATTRDSAIALARQAGARQLVVGDLRRTRDSLVAEVDIVDPKSRAIVHRLDPISVPFANSYAIVERLREGVSGALAAFADTLYLAWSKAHSRPPTHSAFQEFMQGLDALVHQNDDEAIRHLQAAVIADSSFVEAKLWLIEVGMSYPKHRRLVDSIARSALEQRSQLGDFDRAALDREVAYLERRLEDAHSAARRMVSLSPDLQDAQVLLAQTAIATRRYREAIKPLHQAKNGKGWLSRHAQFWIWDLQAHRLVGELNVALREWQAARAALPTNFNVCAEGVFIVGELGRDAAVESLIEECSHLPGAPRWLDREYARAGRAFRRGGHFRLANRAFEQALTLLAASPMAPQQRRVAASHLLSELGRWKEAIDSIRPVADSSSVFDQVVLGVAAAHLGDSAIARSALDAIDRAAERAGSPPDFAAKAFVILAAGQRDSAITLLSRAVTEQGTAPAWNAWYVRYELEPLRNNPRFMTLIRPR